MLIDVKIVMVISFSSFSILMKQDYLHKGKCQTR